MATRLKTVMNKLIGIQQTGFLEKRQISDNIAKTMDMVAYANYKKKSLLIVTIDFEKCFDCIAYSAVFGALDYFKIGPMFKRWTSLFFTSFSCRTQNAGFCSKPFIKRSVSQGCNLSPYLFLLCSEVMAHKLTYHPDIDGITIADVHFLLAQFADDTVVFVNFDLKELTVILDTFSHIEKHTGLKINYEKTSIYRTGSLKNSNARLYTMKNLTWSDSDIELLGFKIENGTRTSSAFDEAIKKMEKVCTTWYLRQFTIMGKILIVNTLMASLFVYKMPLVSALTKKQLKKIDEIIRAFLWKKGKSKIKLQLLCNPKDKGGLKLASFNIKQTALKVAWIPKILSRDDLNYIYIWLIPKLKERIWEVNLHARHIRHFMPMDTLWRDILLEWSKIHFTEEFTGKEICKQFLWFNSCICAGPSKTPLCNYNCIENGLCYFGNIVSNDGCPINYEEIQNKFHNCISWIDYMQLIKAIPNTWWELATVAMQNVNKNKLNVLDIKNKVKCASFVYNFYCR